MNKKLIALAFAAGTALASAPASAIVVSGIDFSGTTLDHIETMTLAQQFINPATTAPGTGSGTGYGYITTINGNTNYSVNGGGLYYTVDFSGGTFVSASEVQFTGTNINLYYLGGSILNLFSQDSVANLALITAGTLYADLVGHGNLNNTIPANVVSDASGLLTGATLSFLGAGLLDVVVGGGGDAAFENFLNGDKVIDAVGGKADLAYTESANNQVLNPKDVANGLAKECTTGGAATGQWCLQGTLNARGTGVPEPGTLALLALGLLGSGLTRRRR